MSPTHSVCYSTDNKIALYHWEQYHYSVYILSEMKIKNSFDYIQILQKKLA